MSDNNVTAALHGSLLTPPDRQGAPDGAFSAGDGQPEVPYRELFLAVAELLPEAIYTKDLQGRYTFINSAGARYLGLSVAEILGRKDSDLMTAQEAQNTLEFDRQTLLSGRTLHAEMTEFLGGMRREWISTKGILRRPDGQVTGLFGISRDLSAHRRSEEAQQQSEALFRATAHSSFDAFFLLQDSPDGLRLLRLNAHGEALLGRQATDVEGSLFTDFPQAGFIAPAPLCREVWRSGKPHDEEVEQVLPQGRRWFRRQLSAVGNCMAVMMRDITQQRENELRLRLNERMAAIGMLAAGVAHEINNPLAFVSSNLNFIDTELRRAVLPSADMSELKEAIADAREGAERMRIIVQSLKALSRGDSITTQPVDLNEVLENSVHLAWSRLRSKGRLVRDYGELSLVQGNSVQLSQVFVNLLINAAQALSKTGGEIRLVTRMHSPERVLVEVHDNGCGIAAEHLDRIFEPFFTTKPVGEGTGLGLSISHDIIRGLGGELSVSSTLDVGTTFRILLPATPGELGTEPLPPRGGIH
jgi:two-component system, NtrC family, sensor kinase